MLSFLATGGGAGGALAGSGEDSGGGKIGAGAGKGGSFRRAAKAGKGFGAGFALLAASRKGTAWTINERMMASKSRRSVRVMRKYGLASVGKVDEKDVDSNDNRDEPLLRPDFHAFRSR